MKIGIYKEPGISGMGGSEYLVVRLAAGLARSHDVELVHPSASLGKAPLEVLSGENLSRVGLRQVRGEPSAFPSPGPIWRSLHQDSEWYRSLSEPYDLFINSTHGMPPFCHARRGILMVLFPLFNRFDRWPWKPTGAEKSGRLRQSLRRYCYERAWNERINTYQSRVAISEFTRIWTKRWWGVDCEVVYPPVDVIVNVIEKTNSIVSVGRFVARGVVKKQIEMMRAFLEFETRFAGTCEYYSVGGVGAGIEDQEYMLKVRQLADGARSARVLTNVPRSELMSIYEHAKVFWHATGYGEDQTANPLLAEHFGIVTVEAMAAGCVPVVINRGAQSEIVQHGINGFLWDTLDELKDYTGRLLENESLRITMAGAARARAQLFTGQKFTERFESIINALP